MEVQGHSVRNFPLWLSPTQAVIIPIADRHLPYAQEIAAQLKAHRLRIEVDSRSERMNAKIRDAQLRKIPYMLGVGDREMAAQAAALRVRGGTDLGALPVTEIVAKLRIERDTRALVP